MTEQTPRVTASYLEPFSGQTVRLLGKVVQVRGTDATIDAGGLVKVILNRESHLQPDHAFEVIGKVMNDLSIKALMCTDFGTNIDMNAMEAVVDATHRYHEIFYEKQ